MDDIVREHLLTLYSHAAKSPDLSTQNAAMIVNRDFDVKAVAINSFPNWVRVTRARLERPAKYDWTNHAEAKVIANAACKGVRTYGKTMIATWNPCAPCARQIIDAGISALIVPHLPEYNVSRWTEQFDIANEMLLEAAVKIINIEDKVGAKVLRNGSIIEV